MDTKNYYDDMLDDLYRIITHRKFKFPADNLNHRQQHELLESLQVFYEDKEDYLRCAKLRDIIAKHQKKSIKVVKKVSKD